MRGRGQRPEASSLTANCGTCVPHAVRTTTLVFLMQSGPQVWAALHPHPQPGAHKMGSPTNRTESGEGWAESQVMGLKVKASPAPPWWSHCSWVLRIRTESGSLSRVGAEARVTAIVHAHPSTPVLSHREPGPTGCHPQELEIRAKVGGGSLVGATPPSSMLTWKPDPQGRHPRKDQCPG